MNQSNSQPLNIAFVQAVPCIRNYKMASALRARGHSVTLLYHRCKLSEVYPDLSDDVYNESLRFTSLQDMWSALEPFDLVHCHNQPDNLTVAALAGPVPVIHDTHDLISLRADLDEAKRPGVQFFEGIANRGSHGRVYSTPYQQELAEQAATGSYSSEQRVIMDAEYGQLGQEITRIAQNTAFNGINLLAAGGNTYGIHIGSTTMIDLTSSAMTAAALGVSTTGVKEAYLSDRGRATSYASNFIADSEITAATADMINFKFGATGTLAQVDLSAYATTGISLDLLVDEINMAWQGQVASGVQVAFAYFDSDAAQWKLKVEDPTAEAEAFTLDNTNAIASFDELSEWSELASGVAGATVSLTDTTKAANALAMVTTAITAKDSYRAELGYLMNRLDAAVNVLNIQTENLLSAESRISDVDVATEMAAMTRNQVLAQAGVSMLAQANSMPQMALKLLG